MFILSPVRLDMFVSDNHYQQQYKIRSEPNHLNNSRITRDIIIVLLAGGAYKYAGILTTGVVAGWGW